jgi:hypothetical protein
MFTLITFNGNTKCRTEFETLEEALSGAIHAFDLNHELHAIEKDGLCLFLHGELYEAIKKAIY